MHAAKWPPKLSLAATIVDAGCGIPHSHAVHAAEPAGVHLAEMGKGKTYSQLSAASLAQPKNAALAGLVQTVFRGTTLRSMLLEAYGFWQIGQIALFGAIASFIGAGLLLILSILGLVHERKVPAETEVLAKTAHTAAATA